MKIFNIPLALILLLISSSLRAEVVVIGHKDIKELNANIVMRIFTGRVIEVEGVAVIPVNIRPSAPVRDKFLSKYLGQNEDKYSAYWTVRRFIGKGTPPREVDTDAEVIEFVRNNSGAVGYVDDESTVIPSDVYVLKGAIPETNLQP